MHLLREKGLDVSAAACTKDQALAELLIAFKLKYTLKKELYQ
jgi:hypothetical protein